MNEGGRAAGKTARMVKLASENNYLIVCRNRQEKERINTIAEYLGLKIPGPLTMEDLINKEKQKEAEHE